MVRDIFRKVKNDPNANPINNRELRDPVVNEGSGESPDIISANPLTPLGRRNRQLIRWRVPGLGFVDMYINPQSMNIREQKVIQKQRTKGGYVVQYWGEELITIGLSGTTGASGIEGINILRKVYRAEQDAFQQVEKTLADRLNEVTTGGFVSGLIQDATQRGIGAVGSTLISTLIGGSATPPLLPTLGSLAVAVELYFQGWVFKGYFNNFEVREEVSNGVGVFNYSMEFIVTDRRGVRSNFMGWHRSPAILDEASGNPIGYNKADSSSTPLSFKGEKE
jgi:hypothetical protein